MSYEFYMAFAKAETISDAYQIAHSFVNEYLTFDRMKEIIKENLYFIPSIKWSCHCDERQSLHRRAPAPGADRVQ